MKQPQLLPKLLPMPLIRALRTAEGRGSVDLGATLGTTGMGHAAATSSTLREVGTYAHGTR
jgi:hypothetical protein